MMVLKFQARPWKERLWRYTLGQYASAKKTFFILLHNGHFFPSASWCGPCQRFTPELVKYYDNFKASHAQKEEFEIIFISSDRSEAMYKAYFHKMPWLALPYGHQLKAELSAKYGIRSVPALVFIDAKGQLVTKAGREEVGRDPLGKDGLAS